MLKLYLQNIIDDISFENLPAKWRGFDFSRFSKDKTLFDFQKQGLQNALKEIDRPVEVISPEPYIVRQYYCPECFINAMSTHIGIYSQWRHILGATKTMNKQLKKAFDKIEEERYIR